MTRQGTVTLDINDYDSLLENAIETRYVIRKDDDGITVVFPALTSRVIKELEMSYPDCEIAYWQRELSIKVIKKQI